MKLKTMTLGLCAIALSIGSIGAVYAAATQPVCTVVLLRHGQSQWNLENRFTGWSDVALTEKGRQGALKAGKELAKAGVKIDLVHTSYLSRAIMTANLALEGMDAMWLPMRKYWRLNERCYGDLEGKTREEVTQAVGKDQVKIWRRSFDVPPPALKASDPRSPLKDVRYKGIDPKLIPASESLKDVIARMKPYWDRALLPTIKTGRTVLVVGHSTCLRALSSYIEPTLTPDKLQKLEIGNTKPVVYKLDKDFHVVSRTVLSEEKKETAK